METPGTETTKSGRGRRGKGKGRRDNAGQEKALDISRLNDDMQKLLNLRKALADASEDYSEAVKKTAEASGFNASVVRKLVDAKHGDKFEDVKRIVDQMGEAFELAG